MPKMFVNPNALSVLTVEGWREVIPDLEIVECTALRVYELKTGKWSVTFPNERGELTTIVAEFATKQEADDFVEAAQIKAGGKASD